MPSGTVPDVGLVVEMSAANAWPAVADSVTPNVARPSTTVAPPRASRRNALVRVMAVLSSWACRPSSESDEETVPQAPGAGLSNRYSYLRSRPG